MKKALSVILAIITMFSIAIPAFAVDENVKDVDNTFDNFEPAPGKKAPDNWYDPYCYEADGRINKYCLSVANGFEDARFCPTYKKIFTVLSLGRKTMPAHYENIVEHPDGSITYDYYPEQIINFIPYEESLKDWTIAYDSDLEKKEGFTYEALTIWYCPYCGTRKFENYTGQDNYKELSAHYTHPKIHNIYYGYWHDECSSFVISRNLLDTISDAPLCFKSYCLNWECHKSLDLESVKLYRFLSEEQRNSEYSFIFTETEKDFGDGKDGRVEDLKKNHSDFYNEWDSEDNPYRTQKLTFWKKIAAFFAKIALWFKNLFK